MLGSAACSETISGVICCGTGTDVVKCMGLSFSEPVRGCFNCNRSVFEPVLEHVGQVLGSVACSATVWVGRRWGVG